MIFSSAPTFRNPLSWIDGTLMDVPAAWLPDGNGVVVQVADQAITGWPAGVLSVQPDGSYQTRPSGTAGAYEVAEQVADKLIYRPGQPFVILTVGA